MSACAESVVGQRKKFLSWMALLEPPPKEPLFMSSREREDSWSMFNGTTGQPRSFLRKRLKSPMAASSGNKNVHAGDFSPTNNATGKFCRTALRGRTFLP